MSQKKTYFFLRGYMRSGTNWIGNLLNLHPDIICNGEYHLDKLHVGLENVTEQKNKPYSMLMSPKLRSKVLNVYERFVKRLIDIGSMEINKPDATILGARTPCPLSPKIIRSAKKIHVVRDGRDCLVSATFHFLRMKGTDYPFEKFKAMREKRAEFQANPQLFIDNPERLLDNEVWVRKRSKSWGRRYKRDRVAANRNSDKVFQTRYETLHADTESERRKMYEFLGADPNKAEKLNDKTSAGFEKENLQSHYRKGSIGDWKNYFNEENSKWFAEEAGGESLILAGYEPDRVWAGIEST